MTRLVPVREISDFRLTLPISDRWVDELTWIPVSTTEVHLACRYYPLAIRFDEQTPRLGLIVGNRYLAHELLDSSGAWRGAYRPIALRCFPFSAPCVGDDPLTDIVIDADSAYLSKTEGIPLVDNTGQPARLLTELHRLFCLLKQSQGAFAGMLDQYLIGGLLVPLSDSKSDGANDDPSLYVLDPARFLHVGAGALAAMARHRFSSVDIAIACQFSMQNLRPDYRPKHVARARHELIASTPNAPAMMAFDDLSLALDDSELVSLRHIDALRAEAQPDA